MTRVAHYGVYAVQACYCLWCGLCFADEALDGVDDVFVVAGVLDGELGDALDFGAAGCFDGVKHGGELCLLRPTAARHDERR